MRAFVYRNLNKPGVVWSVQNTKTGRVAKHAKAVLIEDAELVVQPGGRKRVLKEKRKNVHAGIRGELSSSTKKPASCIPITYDPYKYRSFVRRDNGKAVFHARVVYLGARGACAVDPNGSDD